MAVGALEPKFFSTLCALLDRPDLLALHVDPARQDELRGELTEIFGSRPQAEWTARLAGADTCVAPVLDRGEALNDPNARARGSVVDMTLDDGTVVSAVAPVARLSGTPGQAGSRAPRLGEHNAEIFADLGVPPTELAALRARGVL